MRSFSRHIWLAVLSLCSAALLPVSARAQLTAFPGAEGAGKFAAGGRGGDVYFVTNLNDSGAGSLRSGISTASGARTIVFKVAGTIHLTTDLSVNKPNITIAGQTAPGGGITIADRELHVSNTHDVIVQYLRFRPGDTFTQPSNPTGYQPDSLGIENSSNVMIDHVTGSWSVDEVLSVTQNSTAVTVQWSVISEALHNANHPDGGDHSFGSLINGGDITYAYNLYASNRSRNPRAEGGVSTGTPGTTKLDFVNNVIENPGDRYGYSGNNASSNDAYSMNYVNNYGIKGPNTTATALFVPASTASTIYAPAGSYIDSNANGTLDGAAAAGTNFVNGAFTASATRIDDAGKLPLVTTYDANRAYVEVLSRAGANFYRDPVDRRVVRSVINQTGTAIDSPSQVGGWPTLPTGSSPVDSNSDGVPDYFALANGINTTTNIRNTLARDGSGYTYMERFLQSQTPNATPVTPAALQTIGVRTSFGRGADAQVSENGGNLASSTGNGLGTTLGAQWGGATGTVNQPLLLKFDLAQIRRGSVTDASLQLTAASNISGSHSFNVYGLEQDAAGWDWQEADIQFYGAPGLTYDGKSSTLGLDPANHEILGILSLGNFTVGPTAAGGTVNFSNPNLAVFLNLTAYFQSAAQDNLITILLEQTNSSTTPASFYSKEGNSFLSPQLAIAAMLAPLKGDFNRDGFLTNPDAQAMLTALLNLNGYQTSRGLTSDDLLAIGDINGDGFVDTDDVQPLLELLAGTGGGALSAVPEPSTVLLVGLGGPWILGWVALGRFRRLNRLK